MSRFSYDDLLGQKMTLIKAIGNENDNRRAMESKIRRLEKAISSLDKNITVLEEAQQKYTNLSIDTGSWRGVEKDKFMEQFQVLSTNTKNHIAQTNAAKSGMEQALSKCEDDVLRAETVISHLEGVLSNVQSDMAAMLEGRKR